MDDETVEVTVRVPAPRAEGRLDYAGQPLGCAASQASKLSSELVTSPTSTVMPDSRPGQVLATATAASRSAARIREYPPSAVSPTSPRGPGCGTRDFPGP